MPKFRVQPDDSRVWIEATTSIHPVRGEAAGLDGWVEVTLTGGRVDPSEPASARLELPVDQLSSGNALYDRELQRRIDARRHPTITGETGELHGPDAADRYRVVGDITFHGVTRTVEGAVTMTATSDGALVVEGEHEFDVRDFGMDPPRIAMLRVHPQVRVRVRVVARPEHAPVG